MLQPNVFRQWLEKCVADGEKEGLSIQAIHQEFLYVLLGLTARVMIDQVSKEKKS